jgi:hypothetical protein
MTPDAVDMTFIIASAHGFMCSCVFANMMAVVEVVATASERRNHPPRNSMMSRKRRASLAVLYRDFQAKITYETQAHDCFADEGNTGSGGPGLGLSHMAAGMEKTAHQAPIVKSATL